MKRLQPDARPAANLETAFGTTVSLLNTNRLEQGITLSNITSGSGLNSSGATSLDAVAQRVPGTPVRTMRLNVRGTYRDHARLLAYFDALRANGVAVVFLKVEKNNFEAGLRVFGS